MNKFYRAVLLIMPLFPITHVFGQVTLAQLTQLPYGAVYASSSTEVKSLFAGKAKIMKGDFFNAYRIEAENISFDFFGVGDFQVQYAKDTLVSASVEFDFTSPDTAKFSRLLTTLVSEFKLNGNLKQLKQYGMLQPAEILPYINKHCVENKSKSAPGYMPINTKFLGQSIWAIYQNGTYTGKFVRVYVQLTEQHNNGSENGVSYRYDGGVAELVLEVKSAKLQDLANRLEDLNVSHYTLVEN